VYVHIRRDSNFDTWYGHRRSDTQIVTCPTRHIKRETVVIL